MLYFSPKVLSSTTPSFLEKWGFHDSATRAQNFEKSWIFVKTKKMRGATFPKATTRPSRGGDFPAILGLEK